jgi:GDP-mannose 6-dehydrogenase
MRISVFGIGYVGVVSCGCLAELGHEVIGVDLSADKVTMLGSGRSPIVEEGIDTLIGRAVQQGRLIATSDAEAAVVGTDVSFISVGTPSAPDGSVAMDGLDNVINAIGAAVRNKNTPHVVVMRSTVPPGSGEERFIPMLEKSSHRSLGDGLRYYSNPEFLREGSSVGDFSAPPFTLIGAPLHDDAVILREIYSAIDAPIHVTAIRTAESVKHISNVFHGLFWQLMVSMRAKLCASFARTAC